MSIVVQKKDGAIEYLNYQDNPKRFRDAENKIRATGDVKFITKCGALAAAGGLFLGNAITKLAMGNPSPESLIAGAAGSVMLYACGKLAFKTINEYGNRIKEESKEKEPKHISHLDIMKRMLSDKQLII